MTRDKLREALILKGVGKISGDGWKDTTRIGEVVFVWNAEKPSPYAPGQFPRIGCEGWCASDEQYDFTPAATHDLPAILAALDTEAVKAETEKAAEHAYGLLWHMRIDNSDPNLKLASDARKALLEAIGKAGQLRGIDAAKMADARFTGAA